MKPLRAAMVAGAVDGGLDDRSASDLDATASRRAAKPGGRARPPPRVRSPRNAWRVRRRGRGCPARCVGCSSPQELVAGLHGVDDGRRQDTVDDADFIGDRAVLAPIIIRNPASKWKTRVGCMSRGSAKTTLVHASARARGEPRAAPRRPDARRHRRTDPSRPVSCRALAQAGMRSAHVRRPRRRSPPRPTSVRARSTIWASRSAVPFLPRWAMLMPR